MINVEITKDTKAKVGIEGNIEVLYEEIALAVKLITDNLNKEFEENSENRVTTDEIIEEIRNKII